MKKRAVIAVTICLVILAGLSIFSIQMVNAKLEPKTIYMYTRQINGTSNQISEKVISDNDIKAVTVTSGSAEGSYVTKKEDIIGKTVNTIVYPNTPVFAEQLADTEEDIFKELYEKEDITTLRTCSLEIPLADALGGNLHVGQRVDIAFIDEGTKTDDESSGETFTYGKYMLEDVWVKAIQTADGYKYIDYTDQSYEESKSSYEPMQMVTFIGSADKMMQLKTRSKAGQIVLLGRLNESEDLDKKPSYVIGSYQKIYSGNAEVETNTK